MATYAFNIDWSNNGVWTNTGEDVTTRVREDVTIEYGRDQARALSPIASGSAGFDLLNTSKDYSPENSSSPLYGLILPARPTRIQATHLGSTYTLFRGHLDEFNVLPAIGERKVAVTCLDALAKLKEAKATTTLYPSIRTGDAIAAVLDAIGWPAAARDLDVGATTLRWWAVNGDDAWTAIQNIISAEGSPAIITSDSNGNVVFRDRHHRLLTTLNANPTMEGSVSSWGAFGGTLTLETSIAHNGQNSAKFVPDGVTAIVGIASEQVAATAGTKYTATGWMRCAVARSVTLNINWFNASAVYLSTSGYSQSVSANTWTYFINEFTAPANTAFAQIIPTMSGTPAGSNILYSDNIRLQVASASAATFRDTGSEPTFSAPLVYDQGWRDIVNDVSFDVEERGPASEMTVIWSSDQTYSVGASSSLSFTITTDNPFFDADVDLGDYTVLSGSAGVAIDQTQGQSTTVTITAGGSGAVVTSIQIRGHVVAVLRTLQIAASDATSIATYGSRSGPESVGAACVEDAQAVADRAVLTRKIRLPIVSLDVIGSASNTTRLTQCMVRNLSDRVTIIDAETGLNRDFYIEQIKHSITAAGIVHRTTFGCEAVPSTSGLDDPTTAFIFDHPSNGKFGTGRFAS